jgi:hypothetical protein
MSILCFISRDYRLIRMTQSSELMWINEDLLYIELKVIIFWNVTTYFLVEIYWAFGGIFSEFFTLKKGVVHSSESSLNVYQTTREYVPIGHCYEEIYLTRMLDGIIRVWPRLA